MIKQSDMMIDRLAGAEAISAKAKAIGMDHDVVISECVWDIGEDLGHEHAHRLDLITATKTVRLYFPDLELTGSANASRAKRTEDRLQRAVAQILSRSPLPTYTYQ
ncbi:hypothetical protein ACFQAT_07715 [Undibacterium arcticum]|uniref:Uncharacterized protein n=1 Tax=Undibacterium arcticum TaxID=1762892 RepID=A0ABV7EY81_9BURK